jgi:integrase
LLEEHHHARNLDNLQRPKHFNRRVQRRFDDLADGWVSARSGILSANDPRRFGFHNLRHSLASFLVSVGTNPKVVQGLLRHSDVHTTLQLYSQRMSADRLAAQGTMLDAMGVRPELVN